MGAFLETIKNRKINVDTELLNSTGSKLREYFCSYRSICENFSISIPEYMQIFGSNVKSFSLWDPYQNGVINAMEMFSGLIIFSKMLYEDKIKFLYEFFDLNEENHLDYDDLTFMFISICEATCKIYEIESQIITEEIIEEYLDEFFSIDTKLKYEDFIRWSYRTEEIVEYFNIIAHPFEPQINKHSIDEYDETNLQSRRTINNFNYKKESQIKIKIDERFLNIIKNDHILQHDNTTEHKQEFNPVMKWVYGIRIDDIRYPLQYKKSQFNKAANEKFIYICGKNVVVLYPKLNCQKNYTEHDQSVSCIEMSACGKIAASGEMGINPSIHIWDLKTTKCLYKFTKVHKNSIRIIKFTKENELIITIGGTENKSIVILNLKNKEKILSTYFLEPVLNVIHCNHINVQNDLFFMILPSSIVKCSSESNEGYLLSYHQVSAFVQSKNTKKITETEGEYTKIQTGATVQVNDEKKILLLDQINRLALLNPQTLESELIDNTDLLESLKKNQGTHNKGIKTYNIREEKIIDIFSFNSKRIYFLFQKSFKVYEFDSNSQLNSVVEMRNIPPKLFNLDFVQLIEVNETRIILISLMGDVIEVSNLNSFHQIKKTLVHKTKDNNQINKNKFDNSFSSQEESQESKEESEDSSVIEVDSYDTLATYRKFYQIFKIEKITGICFLTKTEQIDIINEKEKSLLLIASNSLIYMIDQTERELLSLQCLEQNITHIHSYGEYYAVATELKYLIILKDGVTIEKAKCSDLGISSSSVINGFKMTGENLIIAIDMYIEVYIKSNNTYLNKDPKRIKLEHGIPIHIAMTSIPKVFIVITKEKTILKLNSESKEKNPVLTAKELNCDFLQTMYPETNTIKIPILFSGTKSIFLVAQPNGDIYYWNSLSHLINKQSYFSSLSCHSSPINELVFTSNGFISSGSEDGQVVDWENKEMIIDSNEEVGGYDEQINLKVERNRTKRTDEHHNKGRDENSHLKTSNTLYSEEIYMFSKIACDKLPLRDSQIEVIVKNSEFYKEISKIINSILIPKNLELYEPLAEKRKTFGAQEDKKASQKIQQSLLNSTLNFDFSFVYGFNSEKSRQTLFYVHHYTESNTNKQNKNIFKPQENSAFKKRGKEIEYAEDLLLPLNEIHHGCRRSLMYFTGRIGVLWSPTLKKQSYYNYHINRITCAAVHPNKTLVCTSEIGSSFPHIHIWSTNSLTMIFSIKTRHFRFISKLEFSRDGEFIVSLGGLPLQQSIEIHNIVKEESVCFRYIEDKCFYDIKFNPYNFNEIAICGVNSLWIMGVSNRTFIKKEEAKLDAPEDITCMVYTSSAYGNQIESDIITGNSSGDISLFICGKYIKCKKEAHQKSINCLKLCELFKYRTVLISASEDGIIKLWDTKFNEISKINIKEILNPPKSINEATKISISPQSIDVFHCLATKTKIQGREDKSQNSDNTETMLLVGTRNGCILEIKISNEYQGIKMVIINKNEEPNLEEKQEISNISEKVQINHITHFNSFPSTFHRSVMFDIRKELMVTYTRSNQYFVLWNMEKREMVKVYKTNSNPSVVKFSKNGLICVGYIDGRVEFFEIGNNYNFAIKEEKLFLYWDYQPIDIVCSENDFKIGIVYVKENHPKRTSSNTTSIIKEETNNYEGEQILVIYEKVFTNSGNPFISTDKNTYKIPNDKNKFKNIYWYDFNTTSQKLIICYTLNDYWGLSNANRRRLMGSLQSNHYQHLYEFIIYDLTKKTEKEFTNEEFNTLNFSPALKAKYNYYSDCKLINDLYSINRIDEIEQMQETENKNKSHLPHDLINQTLSNHHTHQYSNLSRMDKISPESVNPVNSSSLGTELKEEYVPICRMAQYEGYTILGTVYGEIFTVKSSHFYSDMLEEQTEQEQKTIRSRCFSIFDSPITQMQVIDNRLFVSSKDCCTIVELKITIEETSEKINFSESQSYQESEIKNEKDNQSIIKYYETFTKEKIENLLKYTFPKRKNYYEYKLNCYNKNISKESNFIKEKDIDENNQLELEPYHIIGRNSFYKRNNLHINLKDELISFSGCNLLIMTPNGKKSEYHQEFLKLDNSIFSVNPEISTITLSRNKLTLYAGTTEENCQIIIWDISTRTELEHIYFKNYITILLIKVSEQQKHAVILALSQENKQTIFFISLTKYQIIASFCVYQEADICDLEFLPNNEFKFLACGANYMSEWTLRGGLLTCEKYNMKNPKDFIDLNQQTTNKIPVIFYCIIFLKDVAITGGSDGYIYMWSEKNLIKKQNANPKAAILSLFCSNNARIFASGAVDGKAIVWQLGSSSIIQKVFEFNIYSGKDLIVPSKYHIQSVCIGKYEVYVGTRSGEIHKFEFAQTESLENEENYNKKHNHTLILSSFDNDKVNSCSFNISSQKLYILVQSGVFTVFNLTNNEKIKEEKIKIENEEIVKMLVCKLSSRIYIVFKKSIEVYLYIEEGKHNNKFTKAKEFLKIPNSEIKAAILSVNEKYLALLISPNHLENAKIEIYDLSKQDKEFFIQDKVLENIPANIEIIDFSTDNGYLVYKSSEEDETVIDLTTKEMINTNIIEFELEWNEEAKKTSKYIRDICSTYNDENKLRTILQIMNHSVLATDEMGSMRVFHYEQTLEENSIEYYHIYLEHLNDIYLCIISADCNVLVTVGSQDRSIIIWKVKNFDIFSPKGSITQRRSSKPATKRLEAKEIKRI